MSVSTPTKEIADMGISGKKTKYGSKVMTRYEGSGLRASEFCRRHRLSPASFYRWRRIPRGDRPAERLELVAVAECGAKGSQPDGTGDARGERPCQAPGGVSIEVGALVVRVEAGFDMETLARVLEAAGGRPCRACPAP